MKLPPFQTLLDQHRGDVYRFLVATAGPGDADDCFQETWIAALRAYPELRRTDNLRGVAVPDRPEQGDRLAPLARTPAVPVESVPGGTAAAPAAAAPGRRTGALGRSPRLPPKQRTAVFCRSVLGMPYDELAAAAGVLGGRGEAQRARGPEEAQRGMDRMNRHRKHLRDSAASLADAVPADADARLAERAGAEGLLDVAYAIVDSPLGAAGRGRHPAGARAARVHGRHPEDERARGPGGRAVAAACSRRPLASTRSAVSWTSTSRAARVEFDLPLDWSLTRGFAGEVLRQTARIGFGKTQHLRGDRRPRGQPAGGPRRRQRARVEPDAGGRAVPPRAPHRRARSAATPAGVERKEFLLRLEGVLD